MSTKTALITGASSGIGLAFARLFAKDGYDVVLVSRNPEKLTEIAQELKSEYHVRTTVIEKNLADTGSAQALYDEIVSKNEKIDVLVNNAGVSSYGFFAETDMGDDLKMIQLNVISVMQLTKLFLKEMVARNDGKILQISAPSAVAPTPLMSVWSGTKAFIYSFTQALINELKDCNVTMTTLMPGATDTDFYHKAKAEGTVLFNETDLSDPAKVAKDGYDALMQGKANVLSGVNLDIKGAIEKAANAETAAADTMRDYMEKSDESKKEAQ